MDFSFATPLIISGTRNIKGSMSSFFPHPLIVFSELKKRWEDLGGPCLAEGVEQFIQDKGCYISDYKLVGKTIYLPQGQQLAYSGSMVFECRKNEPEYTAALNALARLAFFTGTGYETAQGMGSTRITISG